MKCLEDRLKEDFIVLTPSLMKTVVLISELPRESELLR